MFDHLASSASPSTATHWIVGAGVIALAVVAVPSFGIPVALAAASYGVVKMTNPRKILRGHRLSREQQHRAGLILGAIVLTVGIIYSAADYSLQLAHGLEHKLHHAIGAAYAQGEIRVGEVFTACRGIVCASATIVQPATAKTLGIARLGGFAIHDDNLFGWRQPAEHADARALR